MPALAWALLLSSMDAGTPGYSTLSGNHSALAPSETLDEQKLLDLSSSCELLISSPVQCLASLCMATTPVSSRASEMGGSATLKPTMSSGEFMIFSLRPIMCMKFTQDTYTAVTIPQIHHPEEISPYAPSSFHALSSSLLIPLLTDVTDLPPGLPRLPTQCITHTVAHHNF
jgi:hypothetical protein